MIWILFTFVSVIALSIYNLFQRILMKNEKSDPVLFAISFQFILFGITGIFALYKGFVIPPIQHYWINFLISTVLYGLGTVFSFKAAKKIGAGEMSILSSFGAIIPMFLAVVILQESFSLNKLIGTGLILLSIVLLYGYKNINLKKGSIYTLIMAVCYGLAVVNDAYVLKTYDAVSYVPVISLLPGTFLLIIKPQSFSRVKQFVKGNMFRNMIILCSLYGIHAITYFLALQSGAHASQMLPITKSSIILTVILAALFLQERKQLFQKTISAILVTIGVLMLV